MSTCNSFRGKPNFYLAVTRLASLLRKDEGEEDGFPPARESGQEGQWMGTGFRPELSRQ